MFQGRSNHEELALERFFAARGEVMKVDARFRQLRSLRCGGTSCATALAVVFCLSAPFRGAQRTGGRFRGSPSSR
jgi:hypothetical protein